MTIWGAMQHLTSSPASDCHAAQDYNQVAGSLSKHSTAAQPEQLNIAHMTGAPGLQPTTAVSSYGADGAVHQPSDTRRIAKLSDGYPPAATAPATVPVFHAAGVASTIKQSRQACPTALQGAVPQPLMPEQQADLCRRSSRLGRQPAVLERDGDIIDQHPASMEGTAASDDQPSSDEVTAGDGRNGSAAGTATAADGHNGSTEGQASVVEGQAGKPDGQSLNAAGHDTGKDKLTALADDKPAVFDDTISEACCVCKFAEDGEIMLLCDKCNQPAHLQCAGVDSVPEGDWFCPACTSAMVCILTMA